MVTIIPSTPTPEYNTSVKCWKQLQQMNTTVQWHIWETRESQQIWDKQTIQDTY